MKTVIKKKEFIGEQSSSAMCHASSLLPLNAGKILAAWFGGSHEGSPDTGIWFAVREKTGWSEPVLLAQSNEAHWNPVLMKSADGGIILFFKVGQRISEWRTLFCSSFDEGKTWTAPAELVPFDRGGRGPVRNKVLRVKSGRLLAPASIETGIWKAFCDISDDEGKTWRKSAEVRIEGLVYEEDENLKINSTVAVSAQSFRGRGVIQPTLWESEPGKVHMLLRSSEARIFRSDSSDNGDVWCPAYPTVLPNNNSGIDLDKTSDGTLFLVYNPVGENWGPRTPITLACSRDNGNEWHTVFDLDTGDGEFSYPCIVAEENMLYISYTWKRKAIRYFELEYIGA